MSEMEIFYGTFESIGKIERMENALAERKAEQAIEAAKTKAESENIINEAAEEAHRARTVRSNFQALTESPS